MVTHHSGSLATQITNNKEHGKDYFTRTRKPKTLDFHGRYFFINGITHLINEQTIWYRSFLGIVMISIIYGFYATWAFSERSKYSAKVRGTDRMVDFKNSFWNRTYTMNWSDIKLIHFANYKEEFELFNGTLAFQYNANSQKSKQLKSIIREYAARHKIQVIGG